MARDYAELREKYASAKTAGKYVTLDEARRNRLAIDWKNSPIWKPKFTGIREYLDYPLTEIGDYISWLFFFLVWQIKGKFPELLDDPEKGKEARKLYADALEMLEKIKKEKWLTANGVVGIFPANSVGDDIQLYADESRAVTLAVFRNLRNQALKENNLPNLCLSDYIAPLDSGRIDYLGAFAVTAGLGADKLLQNFEKEFNNTRASCLKQSPTGWLKHSPSSFT